MEQLTPKQQLVYDCIRKSPTPQGAYDLLDKLRLQGFRAPTQMYRVLHRLLELGIIHKVESLNSFVACGEGHHHGASILAICDDCGSVEELPTADLADQIKAFGSKHEFNSRELTIELKGRCSDCR